jgi:hypothetical protein
MLRKRTFITEDAKGCEMEVVALTVSENGKKIESECRYSACGITTTNLKELKKKVSEIPY